MAKPIQIAVSCVVFGDGVTSQQWDASTLVVLCDDGKIYQASNSAGSGFVEIEGPWSK